MVIQDNDLENQLVRRRREWVFLILAGIFLGSLTMLNILGVSRFIDLSSYVGISDTSSVRFSIAVGVLPYPITFLCTDIVSEIYGRKRANMLVWVGLFLNIWVLLVMWFGGWIQAPENLLPDGTLPLEVVNGEPQAPYGYAFYEIRMLTFGATFASMIAYITAQFVDVQIFHWLKNKTKGKLLWLRNNVSTLTSQLIDSIAVILITHYYAHALPIPEGANITNALIAFIVSSYLFKFFFALVDTIPIYIAVKYLRRFLHVKDELRF
ncbi:MAG: queuosine precursor transporter [Crocinitomicaceae bacterium]|nr:queuosine precursor transporter [Crocinitomicaceae bacterium]